MKTPKPGPSPAKAGSPASGSAYANGKESPSPLWLHDQKIASTQSGRICIGFDEAGRGPLAGNVVAACVALDLARAPITGLNDSKKLSEASREALYAEIVSRALAFGIGQCSPAEIDRINILQATFLAMTRALAALRGCLPQEGLIARPLPEAERNGLFLLIDGNKTIPGLAFPQQALVKGDGLSAGIAAASILAKVTRDRQLMELDAKCPQYGFAQHKGYPTEAHREAVMRHGMSPSHRRSFCAKFLGKLDLFTST